MADRKVALITGSGKRRVGAVIAAGLADAGFDIVVHFNRSESEANQTVAGLEAKGVRAIAVGADLREESQVDALIDKTVERFGRLDALVCAAAVWTSGSLEDADAARVRKEWEINALGTWLCCRRAGLQMAGQPEGGNLVLIGDWAIVRPYAEHAAYFLSKGVLPTMTRTLAVELAGRNRNIRVNCILPGPVMMPDDMPRSERQAAIDATLVKREGSPENVAHSVRFFLENDFVTGVCLPVDGGRTVYAPDQ